MKVAQEPSYNGVLNRLCAMAMSGEISGPWGELVACEVCRVHFHCSPKNHTICSDSCRDDVPKTKVLEGK